MTRPVHDNVLLSYEVNARTEQIILHTVYEDREPNEHTDIVFEQVVAYHFELDNFSTILFDVGEVEAARLYQDDRDRFVRGQKYGWPGSWNTSEEACRAYFAAHGVKGWHISSSYGMHGWVLAGAMQVIARDTATVEGESEC